MSLNYSENLFQGWEVAIAKKYVRQFRSTCQCLQRDVFEDLVDECLKHRFFLRDTVKPEEEEKRKAYMVRIIKNQLTDIVRRRRTVRRNDFFQAISLDQFLEDNTDSPFLANPHQRTPAEQANLSELSLKLTQIFQKLTPQQQRIYSALSDGNLNLTEISVQIKVTRMTVHNEIKRIRQVFESEGLKKYLP